MGRTIMKNLLIILIILLVATPAVYAQTWTGINNEFRATNVTDVTAGHDTAFIVDGTNLRQYLPSSWSPVGGISNPGAVECQQNNAQIVYTGVPGFNEYSTNRGQTWTATSLDSKSEWAKLS